MFYSFLSLGDDAEGKKVLVLSYPQYCRYRSIIARLRERPNSLLTDHVVLALGGIASLTNNTQILYCRDTFEHPTLVENESVCDEFGKWNFYKLWNKLYVQVRERKHVFVRHSVQKCVRPQRLRDIAILWTTAIQIIFTMCTITNMQK